MGGVYTWAKSLVESLSEWEFVILNQLSNSNANSLYHVPANVSKVIQLPIFGTNRSEEYGQDNHGLLSKILVTTDTVIEEKFLPAYEEFLASTISDDFDPVRVTRSVLNLHQALTTFDSKKCLEHYLTWETFLKQVRSDHVFSEMGLREAVLAYQIIERGLQILALKVPEIDLVHCSLAWMPSLIAIPAKKIWGSPVVLTEHGVAFRELLLYYNAYLHDEPSMLFWSTFSRNIVRTVYSIADVIVPVCKANAIWERYLGATPEKLRVIYNGVDPARFKPIKTSGRRDRPTVVSVARVDVFKDTLGLIQAISYVKERIPNILCRLYANSNDLEYSQRCLDLVEHLGLEENFKFMGSTSEPERAYNQGDIVIFSSITEGFPFAVVEAMACGKAVVATDVGGVSEALKGCGLLVRSRRPHELALGIIRLLGDESLSDSFGEAGLARARAQFSLRGMIDAYERLYSELLGQYTELPSQNEREGQQEVSP